MPFPRTLSGVMMFIITSMFIIGQTTTIQTETELNRLGSDFVTSFQNFLNSGGLLESLWNAGGAYLAIIKVIWGYLAIMLSVAVEVPTEFYIVFIVITFSLGIAIIKLVRGISDY